MKYKHGDKVRVISRKKFIKNKLYNEKISLTPIIHESEMDVLRKFVSRLLSKQVDSSHDYIAIIDKNFWDLS